MSISVLNGKPIADSIIMGRLYSVVGKPTRNYRLPIHRWFRFPAGFSADFIDGILTEYAQNLDGKPILDPFGGTATSLVCAKRLGIDSIGVEAQPIFYRVGKTKLQWNMDTLNLRRIVNEFITRMSQNGQSSSDFDTYPELAKKCFSSETLRQLSCAVETLQLIKAKTDEATIDFLWLGITSIVRRVSHCCTSPWQYVLPNKVKVNHVDVITGLKNQFSWMLDDLAYMHEQYNCRTGNAVLIPGDARNLSFLGNESIGFAVCSPPYLNNFDYSDATRLEAYILREASSWADVTHNIRSKLIVSTTTQVKRTGFDPETVLGEIPPNIRWEILKAIGNLTAERKNKGGKKNYDIVVSQYFADMSKVLKETARVLAKGKLFMMVVGDSAPYGVHVPTDKWLAELAIDFGFSQYQLIRLRGRNDRWNNRKHRVPLSESLVLLHR